jgi:uncharacterized lipoprotein YehR (DUF1307 family)
MMNEIITRALSGNYVDIETSEENFWYLTIGHETEDEAELDKMQEAYKKTLETLERLGFEIQFHDEYENSYTFRNGELTVNIEDGTINPYDL